MTKGFIEPIATSTLEQSPSKTGAFGGKGNQAITNEVLLRLENDIPIKPNINNANVAGSGTLANTGSTDMASLAQFIVQ